MFVAVVVVVMTGPLSAQHVEVHVQATSTAVPSCDGHTVDNTALAGLLIDLARGAAGHCLRGRRARLICRGPGGRCCGYPAVCRNTREVDSVVLSPTMPSMFPVTPHFLRFTVV